MKKIFAVLLCAMLVTTCAAVTASAYDSPTINPGDSDTDRNGGGDDDSDKDKNSDKDSDSSNKTDSDNGSDKDSSNGSKTSSSTTSTSPKTGAPVSYGVLMAAAALAFGGVALSSKKKIEE